METLKRVKIFEASQHDNTKTEFLPEKGQYGTNVRLANVGVKNYTLNPLEDRVIKYPALCGVYCCIKNIFLYDDTTLVNSCYNVYKLASFLQINSENSRTLSETVNVTRSGMAFLNTNENYQNFELFTADENSLALLSLNKFIPFFNALDIESHREISSLRKNTKLSNEDKRKKIESALNSSVIRFDLFKKPRIVIEYNYDIPFDTLFVGAKSTDTINFNKPSLIMDRLIDELDLDKNVTLKYFEYSHDNYYINGLDEDEKQTINVRLRGCENQYVHKLYFMKSRNSSELADKLKGDGSITCEDELINFKVNNSLIFPEDLDTSSKIAYINTSTLGDVTTFQNGFRLTDMPYSSSVLAYDFDIEMSFMTCEINDVVSSLYFKFSRADLTNDYVSGKRKKKILKVDVSSDPIDAYFFYLRDRVMVSKDGVVDFGD